MRRLAMEMQQINRVLQIAVSIFDSPAKMVKLFQFFRRELVTGQVGNKTFVTAIRKHDTNKTESNRISLTRIPKIKSSAADLLYSEIRLRSISKLVILLPLKIVPLFLRRRP